MRVRSCLLLAVCVLGLPTLAHAQDFGSASGITTRIADKAGVGYETIASMTGIEQLDLLDATHSIVLARTPAGLNLQAVVLP